MKLRWLKVLKKRILYKYFTIIHKENNNIRIDRKRGLALSIKVIIGFRKNGLIKYKQYGILQVNFKN